MLLAQVRLTRLLLPLFAAVWLVCPSASANPVVLNPSSAIAFGMVAFWAFVVEAGIIALLLLGSGLQPLRMFGAYFAANALVFFFVFQPLLERNWPVPLLEFIVVCVDGLAIKFLQSRGSIQSDNYRGVSWRKALLVSLAGNSVSFFVGLLSEQKPWIDHSTEL